MQVKTLVRRPTAQSHPVRIVMAFFSCQDHHVIRIPWIQIVENENSRPQIKDHCENEFPEPETSSNLFFRAGVGLCTPCKAFHVQSITVRSKWLQLVKRF